MNIKIDDLKGEEIAFLLSEHHQDMLSHSPTESVHALDIQKLKSPDITFWTAWIDDELAGCAALKELDSNHGEIKSMRTSKAMLRKGVAKNLLNHLLKESEYRSYSKISLETGSMAAFIPARDLYKRFGFEMCEPFADYKEDSHSVFMTKKLDG